MAGPVGNYLRSQYFRISSVLELHFILVASRKGVPYAQNKHIESPQSDEFEHFTWNIQGSFFPP